MTTTDASLNDMTNAAAMENQFGLADRIVDEAALANSVDDSGSRASRCPRSPSSPTRRRSIMHEKVGDADPQGPDARNLWRIHWYNDLQGNRVDVPDHVVLPVHPDRRREPDHRRVRRPLPDDHGAQGARRLLLPRATCRHRPVRPDGAPCGVAVDRQLRPRRHRDQPRSWPVAAWRSCRRG